MTIGRHWRLRSCRMIGAAAAALLLLLTGHGVAAPEPPSPVGTWRTFSDKTGRERGLVRIWAQNGVLFGSIEGTIDPAEAKRTCDKCRDDRHGKPVLGLNIIRGMRQDGDRWTGGEILDPETGETYRCSMRLEDGGRKLTVRGFVGVSLFGRSQTWLRAQ